MSFNIGNIATNAVNSAVEGAASQVMGAVTGVINSALGGIFGDIFGGAMAQDNPLNVYSSYNYIVTLSALSSFEVNEPSFTYRLFGPTGIVLRSGGSPSNKITADQENSLGIITDLYIDELVIKNIVHANQHTRHTTAHSIEFVVEEPYSMGMFIESLSKAAKSKGFTNYIECPFLLTIEFIGWDSYGNPTSVPNTRRMIPMKFQNAEFTVTESGSKYQVAGFGWNEQALSDEVQTMKSDIEINGRTIVEMLQTGEESLATKLNNREQEAVKKGIKAAADEYVIIFPKDRDSLLDSIIGMASDAIGAVMNPAESEQEAGEEEPSEDDELAAKIYGKSTDEELPEVTDKAKSSVEVNLGSMDTIQSAEGDKYRAKVEDESQVNDIGKSKISKEYITSGKPYFNKPAFVEMEDNPGFFTREQIQVNTEGTSITLLQGFRVQDAIEEVVLLSEYGRQFITKETDMNGMKEWFRIDVKTIVKKSSNNVNKRGANAKLYVYQVIPYKVNTSWFKLPSISLSGLSGLLTQCAKKYDYIYTGQNDDIIDFNIEINYAFIQQYQADIGNASKAKETRSAHNVVDESEDDETGSGDPDHEVRSGSSIPSEGAGTVMDLFRPLTGALSGGGKNHTETHVARSVSDAITRGIDLIQIDLTIWGDPYFLTDSGIGNYTASGSPLINLTTDNTMDYQFSEVDVLLNFRTPVDYDKSGMMQFPGGASSPEYKFSGLYCVYEVESTFSKGQFTQILHMVRRPNQGFDLLGAISSGKGETIVEKPVDGASSEESSESSEEGSASESSSSSSDTSPFLQASDF